MPLTKEDLERIKNLKESGLDKKPKIVTINQLKTELLKEDIKTLEFAKNAFLSTVAMTLSNDDRNEMLRWFDQLIDERNKQLKIL